MRRYLRSAPHIEGAVRAARSRVLTLLQNAWSTTKLKLAAIARTTVSHGARADSPAGIAGLRQRSNGLLAEIQREQAALSKAYDELAKDVARHESTISLHAPHAGGGCQRPCLLRPKAPAGGVDSNTTRRADMAEIAMGVLDHVAKALNTINVSATLAAQRMRQSKVSEFVRAAEIIDEHKDDLPGFIASDPWGQQLPALMQLLATHLTDERSDILKELELLAGKVEHVRTIISTQQSFAATSHVPAPSDG
jgi:hypothetical protein